MKHTTGPWCYGESKGGKWYVYSPDGVPIVPHVCVTKGLLNNEVAKGNAQLMATAPELLDALRAVHALLPDDVQFKVEMLIAKAEGRR